MSNIDEADSNIEYLAELAKEYKVYDLACPILYDKRFVLWSGSSKPELHHYGDYELLQHTKEVVHLALLNAQYYTGSVKIDKQVLFLACLYHDYGKVWDYTRLGANQYTKSSHARNIHHISRSVIEFTKIYENLKSDITFREYDEVIHCILSHHGKREYGSPVAPKSAEAWLLHLSDSISARMNDYNRFDPFSINK